MSVPVIVAGMHRSGTKMLADMLEKAGLFIGTQKEQNSEARFFLRVNRWLLALSGGAWDYPLPFEHVVDTPVLRAYCLARMRVMLNSPRLIQFLGLVNYGRYRSIEKLERPWGWKDPRNTITLPLWLDLFPEARVIYIFRHGVDIAHSLQQRELMILSQKRSWRRKLRRDILPAQPIRWGHDPSPRCYHLANGFNLWETYMAIGKHHQQQLATKMFSVRYETMVMEPLFFLQKMLSFIELECSRERVAQIARQVRSDRAYAYQDKPELQAFATSMAKRLAVYGY